MYYEDEEVLREYAREVWREKRMERITEEMEDLIMGAFLSALEKIKDKEVSIDTDKGVTGYEKVPF